MDHLWRASDRGRSGNKHPTFPGNSKEKKFLRYLTKIADASISIFMGLYKVADWLKSGPFLASKRSRLIRGQAPNISWQYRGKKFLWYLTKIADTSISEFK
jgi:hypothetical protein